MRTSFDRYDAGALLACAIYLYFNLFDLKGTPFLLGGPPFTYGGYIPPLDTRALYSKRAELMQTLCDVGVRYVSGPVSEIAKHIARDMGWPKPATV